jgi:hypothetical protein
MSWAKISAGVLCAVFGGVLALLAVRWPYTQERVIESIERATGGNVRFQKYRATFFPEPGCTIENLAIERNAREPIARAEKLTLQSSWWSVLTFRKRVRRIQSEGLHLQIPSPFPPPVRAGSAGLGDLVIGEFVADGTSLDIAANNGPPLHFAIRRLRLTEVGKKQRLTYETELAIPEPPGQVKSSGTLGPFAAGELARIPVAGRFELRDASLKRYKDLAGILNGEGRFQGPLENIRVTGTASASGFEVNHTGHPLDLRVSYGADVNGTSGDVLLHAVEANFLRTHLFANGGLHGEHGKTVSVQFVSDEARIEDLLFLFTRSDVPAVRAPIRLRASAELPSGDASFLHRLLLRGNFGNSNARWARPSTQKKVNSLSARARGDKKQVEERAPERVDRVVAQLNGDVVLTDGVARLSRVSFHVPGATATGGGTYNLLTKRVDLRGTVSMVADASEAASGIKSFLLKPFDSLFRRHRQKGATLPVRITGQYPRPEYRVGLRK